ncbi:urease accessory protein UreF [Photobacterium sanctipauli]|uniref:Urease accessory protein UreF n=1 Tax=Photobacterium sanctipauli TaxID=1342794 RepID=A0A2T3NZT4_9GAMM|nr:urease accessory protein UreF [Photobacterium sanctipauli]PSW21775.1 urease accessory protein UreF [Photobacterium sanctipauli]
MQAEIPTLPDFRLYQLISPSLPIGAFTYSQGLEWAIEKGWVKDRVSLEQWLVDILHHSLVTLELPILQRLYSAIDSDNASLIEYWNQWLFASRETKELRLEEVQRGKATARLLKEIDIGLSPETIQQVEANQLACFALAANKWNISLNNLCAGYLWSWLENATTAGVKLVPLGQTDGQKLMMSVSEQLPNAIKASYQVQDHEVGSFTPAQAIASSRHETQYTRLYRS